MYRNIVWQTVKKIGSLTFALILLLLIALYSIVGTLIEQEKDIMYYKVNYPVDHQNFFQLNWKSIQYLQLDHVYTSWIFFLFLVTLGLSLVVCTLSTQLPSFRYARRWKFRKVCSVHQSYVSANCNYCLTSYSSVILVLMKRNYTVFQQKKYLYAHKGLIGRLAPMCVHISLILLFLGFLVTFLGGFLIQEVIPVGETFHLQNIIRAGALSNIPKNLQGYVTLFDIDYYNNKDIKQFYTQLVLLKDSHTICSKTISVNQPVIANGLTFYQTDWTINGFRVQVNNLVMQVPVHKFYSDNQNFWLSNLVYDEVHKFSLILSDFDKQVLVYDVTGTLIQSIKINEFMILNHVHFRVLDLINSTGIQIKKDPGTWLVYLGFLILILSTTSSYVTYSQIWAIVSPESIYISGCTNRSDMNFEKELVYFSRYVY